MTLGSLKRKPCRQCAAPFIPSILGQKVCTPACAILFTLSHPEIMLQVAKRASAEQNRQMRKWKKQARAKAMTRSDWLRKAQTAFNRWVRLRDAGKPCISCGCNLEGRKVDAGHYRSVGAMAALRFEPSNCHAQCVPCNQHKSGNALDYRIGLIKRIGQSRVDWLELDHAAKKYTKEQAQEIESHYKALCKTLEAA